MISTDFILEWLGALTGLACVVLTVKRRVICWPVGLVSVVCFAVFFLRIQLYADMALQGFFFATGLYGWWHWKRGGENRSEAPIRVLTRAQRIRITGAVMLCVPVIGWALHEYTDASFPLLDTLVAVLSVIAQLLLMRKYYDAWPVWVLVDLLSLALYGMKEAWVTFGLYAVFLALATAGWVAWRNALKRGEVL